VKSYPRRSFLQGTAAALAAAFLHNQAVTRAFAEAGSQQKPNIVLILSDDVGYGDIGCYGAKLPRTPHIDGLAQRGRRFTDAHSDASVCTPSRYAILSGMYAWRRQDAQILPGDAALLFADHQTTLPSLLQQAGYKTGCVGKWHMGLGRGEIDWNKEIAPGPREVGFNYSFILPATADRVPCVYIENQRVVGLDPHDPIRVDYKKLVGDDPTGQDAPYLLKMKLSHDHDGTIVDGVSRIGFMTGGQKARWVDENMAATLAGKATAFIDESHEHPFFLYLATSDIHVPRMPNERFAAKSQCGVRCDVIEQLDWTVGQVLEALQRHKILDNTLIVFTSDNGPVVDDGYADGSVEALHGHTPSGVLRGGKYELYEGGTRVPFIAYWRNRISTGVSNALISQTDLLASLAALAGVTVPTHTAVDSQNMLPVLTGQSESGRDVLIEADVFQRTAIRRGRWKLLDLNKPDLGKAGAPPHLDEPNCELYDLLTDPGETMNVAAQHPDVVKALMDKLGQIRGGASV
jgi:arylsulfatase A-like enzyme